MKELINQMLVNDVKKPMAISILNKTIRLAVKFNDVTILDTISLNITKSDQLKEYIALVISFYDEKDKKDIYFDWIIEGDNTVLTVSKRRHRVKKIIARP